ncbi:hypothetical protein GARC_2943 [Paraglaciecola arctica BSs20135]|uniref:Uncharacterized protein n=1 Tax=Paraglaciecola arctica BSs20135 TaxID=493475 RepID=K6Y7J5_9ALTE|nr:hypothetical protein GARC_2943 [Paraglaciecola arctica BSs20135]
MLAGGIQASFRLKQDRVMKIELKVRHKKGELMLALRNH